MLTFKDVFLTPLYLIVIYVIAYIYQTNFIKDKKYKKYFMPAFSLKIFGAISLGLVYEFYYGGGDTTHYYGDSTIITNTFFKDPILGLQLFFYHPDDPHNYSILSTISLMIFKLDPSSLFVIKVSALFGLITFSTYSLIAIGFSVISFCCLWPFYISLTKLYPHFIKELAIAVFFIPSVFFWGSGLMKDSLTLAATALIVNAFLQIFIFRKKTLLNIPLMILGFWALKSIKIYIALCLIPALLLYLYLIFNSRIKNQMLRLIMKPFLLGAFILAGYAASDEFPKDDSKYNLDDIAETAKRTSDWILHISQKQDGSFYDLGDYDPSLWGMVSKMPQAIWVTLFRPYIWETRNPIMLLSAIECFVFLLLTLKVFYTTKPGVIITRLRDNPFIQFALVFSLAFSFAIGISTFNFGSLVRYKIPMMPFYLIALFIINYRGNLKQKTLYELHKSNSSK